MRFARDVVLVSCLWRAIQSIMGNRDAGRGWLSAAMLFLDLADMMLLEVMFQLPVQTLCTLGACSARLHKLSSTDIVWQCLCKHADGAAKRYEVYHRMVFGPPQDRCPLRCVPECATHSKWVDLYRLLDDLRHGVRPVLPRRDRPNCAVSLAVMPSSIDEPEPTQQPHIVHLPFNKVLIFGGGQYDRYDNLADNSAVYVLDTATELWTQLHPTGHPPPNLYGCAVVHCEPGMVLLHGGGAYHSPGRDLTALRYTYSGTSTVPALAWEALPQRGPQPAPRMGHTGVCYDGRVFFFGGRAMGEHFNDVHEYNLKTHTWSQPAVAGRAPSPRKWVFAVQAGQYMVLFFGSPWWGPFPSDLSEVAALDLEGLQWETWWEMGEARGPAPRTSPALLHCGAQVLVHGGYSVPARGYFNDVWLFDLRSREWTRVGSGGSPRSNHVLALQSVEPFTALLMFGGRYMERWLEEEHEVLVVW